MSNYRVVKKVNPFELEEKRAQDKAKKAAKEENAKKGKKK